MEKNKAMFSTEYEQALLGRIILDASLAPSVGEILNEDDFYHQQHKTIYIVIKTMLKRRIPIDMLSVADELKNRNKLNAVGGIEYITKLVDAVPNTSNVVYYAKKIKELADKRRLQSYLTNLDYTQSIDSLIYNVRARLTSVHNMQDTPTLNEDINLDELERIATSKTFRTHFPTLNNCARISVGKLITVVGDTSRGKTTFAFNLIFDIVSEGGTVQFFTLDMEKYGLLARIASMINHVDSAELLPDNEHFASHILEAQATEFAKHIILEDRTPYISDIVAKIHASNPDVVVIDYIQNVKVDDNKKSIVEKLNDIMLTLQLEAHDRPIIVLSQVAKGEGDNYMARAKGSSTIAQASSVVIAVDKEDSQFKYRIAKNRTIVGRLSGWVNLDFDHWMLRETI